MERAEVSLEKARDLGDLLGEASVNSFLAAIEQTSTDFDFLHDGLSLSCVSRVYLVLFVGVPVKDVATGATTATAVLSCEFSDHMGCRHNQKITENLALSGNPT